MSSSTSQHCPGFEANKNLKTLICKCSQCGQKIEVFSDEVDRARRCDGCGQEIDFARCKTDGAA